MNKLLSTFALVSIMVTGCTNNSNNEINKQTEKDSIMAKDFMAIAAERYSVRQFSSKHVEQDKIDRILEAGKLAPTAVNSQPQKIFVIKSEEGMKKANEISPCIYGAPHAFLICYDDSIVCPRGNGNYGDIDCSIVLTHMVLEAWNIGVGTCIVGKFSPEDAIKAFNLPSNIHPVLLLPFGYASEDSKPSDRHYSYRDINDMVKYL